MHKISWHWAQSNRADKAGTKNRNKNKNKKKKKKKK